MSQWRSHSRRWTNSAILKTNWKSSLRASNQLNKPLVSAARSQQKLTFCSSTVAATLSVRGLEGNDFCTPPKLFSGTEASKKFFKVQCGRWKTTSWASKASFFSTHLLSYRQHVSRGSCLQSSIGWFLLNVHRTAKKATVIHFVYLHFIWLGLHRRNNSTPPLRTSRSSPSAPPTKRCLRSTVCSNKPRLATTRLPSLGRSNLRLLPSGTRGTPSRVCNRSAF